MKKSLLLLVTSVLSSLALAQPPTAPAAAASAEGAPAAARRGLPTPANPALPSLILIGDSTVRNGRGDGGNGQWGWGEPIADLFDPAKINVVNRAVGGLSSRTYLTGGNWERALPLVKAGDFVIMQFGHNDNGAINDTSRARGTIKGTGDESEEIDNLLTKQHEVVHSYGWYLKKFAAEAKAKGATPIIASLIPRNRWENGKVVREAYVGWAAEAAKQAGVAYLELNELISARYESMGKDNVPGFFVADNLHTTRSGAELNAEIVVAGIKKLKIAQLEAALSEKGKAVKAP